MHRLSLPREHGASIVLAAAVVLGLATAPDRPGALGAALALVSGFLARGPLDRLGARLPLRSLDAPLLGLCAFGAAAGAVVTADASVGMLVLATAFALALGSMLARRARRQRSALVELAGLGLLGASAGLVLLAGRAPPERALGVALLLATCALSQVIAVRAELRDRGDARPGEGRSLSLALLLAGAAALGLWGGPIAAAPLAPMALVRLLPTPGRVAAPTAPTGSAALLARPSAALVGVRETVSVALVVSLGLLLS